MPLRFNGQTQRARAIPEAIYRYHLQNPIDVLVLSELIAPADSKYVLGRLADLGWRYQSAPLPSSILHGQFLSGGVYVVSRHRILSQATHAFTHCGGVDCFISKGIVHCKLQKDGQIIHIFGTHLQAWNNKIGRVVRTEQVEEVRDFIQRLTGSSPHPVLLCGDLNIDRYSRGAELRAALHRLDMHFGTDSIVGHPYTIDPQRNSLVGNDDPSMYSTPRHPRGCYAEYMNSMYCECCPQEWLDYIVYSKDHPQPLTTVLTPILLKTEPYLMRFSATIARTHSDLSDHFPLLGVFTFPLTSPGDTPVRRHLPPPIQSAPHTTSRRLIVLSLLLGVIVYAFP